MTKARSRGMQPVQQLSGFGGTPEKHPGVLLSERLKARKRRPVGIPLWPRVLALLLPVLPDHHRDDGHGYPAGQRQRGLSEKAQADGGMTFVSDIVGRESQEREKREQQDLPKQREPFTGHLHIMPRRRRSPSGQRNRARGSPSQVHLPKPIWTTSSGSAKCAAWRIANTEREGAMPVPLEFPVHSVQHLTIEACHQADIFIGCLRCGVRDPRTVIARKNLHCGRVP